MNPLQILANVGLTLADLALPDAAIKALQVMGSITSNWTYYQTIARNLGLPQGAASAVKLSHVARLLAHPEEWIPFLDPRSTIPRAMSRLSERAPSVDQPMAGFRYDVYISVLFEGGTMQQNYYVGVESNALMSEQAAIDRALMVLEERFSKYSGRIRSGITDWYSDRQWVGGFYRYTMKGV